MKYLGFDEDYLITKGAIHTAQEISFQPQLWKMIYQTIEGKRKEIKEYIHVALKESQKIYLTGAGTSAYIGLSLKGAFQRNLLTDTESLPTTDIVTHPQDYFIKEKSIILVSFARSGNSPESIAAAKAADKYCRKCFHLIITCNPEGQLANFSTKNPKLVIVLPPESNDKSLAMTGSYSGMLLTGLLIANINNYKRAGNQVEILHRYGNYLLKEYLAPLRDIASKSFSRAVFLGSGPQYGTAKESQLKLQEMTDGYIICKSESYLGFRHGPKAVIDNKTLVCYLISNVKQVQSYENDLIEAMKIGRTPMLEMIICEIPPSSKEFDLQIQLSHNGEELEEEFLAVCNILPGQLLAFFKSMSLGLKPDSPSESGAISRVVEGVKIYNI